MVRVGRYLAFQCAILSFLAMLIRASAFSPDFAGLQLDIYLQNN